MPTHLTSQEPLPNLTAWATLAPGGAVRIAMDNLATSGLAEHISIVTPGSVVGSLETLRGSSISATSGITLGERAVSVAGRWQPRLTQVAHERFLCARSFTARLPPSS